MFTFSSEVAINARVLCVCSGIGWLMVVSKQGSVILKVGIWAFVDRNALTT